MPGRAAARRWLGESRIARGGVPAASQLSWLTGGAADATNDAPSPVHAVALIVSVGVLLTVQALLIRRTLDTRRQVGNEPPGESPARELIWAALPAILLLALLLYSLRYAGFI